MKATRIIAGLLTCAAVVSANAHADNAANSEVGKVDTVYVRQARGLFIEKKLVRKIEDKEIWVDARTADALEQHTGGEMFKVPSNLPIERGDLVAMRLGDESARALNLIPIPNQVTHLVARHDTLMAIAFGLPKTSPGLDVFLAKSK